MNEADIKHIIVDDLGFRKVGKSEDDAFEYVNGKWKSLSNFKLKSDSVRIKKVYRAYERIVSHMISPKSLIQNG